jgi:hypothetical protein
MNGATSFISLCTLGERCDARRVHFSSRGTLRDLVCPFMFNGATSFISLCTLGGRCDAAVCILLARDAARSGLPLS